MASLAQQPSGNFVIHFRFAGTRFNRSLQTKDQKEAAETKSLIERTLRLIKQGEKSPPENATTDEVWQFVLTGGKVSSRPAVRRGVNVQSAWDDYFNSIPHGAKEETSVATEQTHSRHFLRHFGSNTAFSAIDAKALRQYINERQAVGRGRHGQQVRGVTIAKELQTFRQLWDFMRTEGQVYGENPVNSVEVQALIGMQPSCWLSFSTSFGVSHCFCASNVGCCAIAASSLASRESMLRRISARSVMV
jgi:hypothetical protein